ncbi:MAG TPA: GNAT family N-acetyltransferase [Lentimicrobium sp.]|jgi:GNAT superfamily N-acetyltransferase|nr:GNAT family N-acetyltransferase [Lentimicrobium sp.]
MKRFTLTNVREASREDIFFIAGCQMQMAFETENITLNRDALLRGVTMVFDDPSRGFYLVAEDRETRAGCLMVTPEWSDWRGSWVWWLQSVYVLPEMRQAGVFGAMYAAVKQKAADRTDVAGIRLYVDKTNLKAREVYQKAGMNGDHYITFEWMIRPLG